MDPVFSHSNTYCFPRPITFSSTRFGPSVTPSLINYVPSSIGGAFQSKFEDSTVDLTRTQSSSIVYTAEELNVVEDPDPRSEELWRAFRDEAGPWMSHRFTLHEWDLPQKDESTANGKEKTSQIEKSESFDGFLTTEIIATGLSKLDRCPEVYHYSYIKLVLSKKRLCDIEALQSYHYLQYVDVSKNKLTTLKPLGNLPFLKYLDASRNLLTTILDFKPAPHFLTSVNLAYNKFKVMRDLSDFWSITDLNLSHNSIRSIDGLLKLSYLTTLNLAYNRIETIENLNHLRIQFLHLQNNQIQAFEDDIKAMLYTLNNIRTINLARNQVVSLKMFESVENLECLEIPYNQVSQLLDIYYLRNLKYLNKLNLLGNAVTNIRRYVEVCTTNIRNLVYLDGEHINKEFWLQKLSSRAAEVSQTAAQQRLKLLLLEQLNKPEMWDWLLPYDTPPLAIIIMVGLQASRRAHIAKKFCRANENVVLGIPYTTRPKLTDELEGELYYYVDEQKFRTMLKEGKFLTYQEHLGFHYGIAHSEFKKAQDGVLLFYTDLSMALSIKSRFFNTKLLLTLPSTRKIHLDNLSKLYAIRLVDTGTMKIINSPEAVKFYEKEFLVTKKKLIEQDVQSIVEELVRHASIQGQLVTEMNQPDPDSSIWQIWSRRIHPLDPFFYTLIPSSHDSFHPKAQSPVTKYVSFTGQKMRRAKAKNDADFDDLGETTFEEDTQDALKGPTHYKMNLNPRHWLDEMTEDDSSKVRSSPNQSPHFCMHHETYSDIICDDERIRAIFTGELNRREELLDLHWSTPGLFRELLLTDQEEETLQKLRQLVIDLIKFSETRGKPMFNFENDETVQALTAEKIKMCFAHIARELSTSDKQAAEFVMEERKHICGGIDCKNPACPPF